MLRVAVEYERPPWYGQYGGVWKEFKGEHVAGSLAGGNRLGREDWLEHALEVLREEGIQGVRVERLARDLKVTKGSFYWHFSGRQELLSAMAERYAGAHHREIRERLETSGLDDWGQLQQLSREAYEKYAKIDHAMRIWAEDSSETREAIKRSDQKVLRFQQEKLISMGVPPARAKLLARLILCTGLGFSIAQPSLGGKKEYDQMGALIKRLVELENTSKK